MIDRRSGNIGTDLMIKIVWQSAALAAGGDGGDRPGIRRDCPGEPVRIIPVSAYLDPAPPVLPYFATCTITVSDVDQARKLIEGNGFTTEPVPSGFVVRSVFGSDLVFTA
jgi:hypothetical protein